MILRCEDKTDPSYSRYGRRGISVCDRWHAFSNFLDDMGLSPVGLWLDRINNDGNYEPSNCRWVSPKESANNRSNSRFVLINGKRKYAEELAAQAGIAPVTMRRRLRHSAANLMAPPTPPTASRNRGTRNGQARLNDIDIERIRDMSRFGVKQLVVAGLFGITADYVSKIHRGQART